MNQQLIDNLPVYYRVDLGEQLREAILMNNSVNLIGLSSVGKYTYLQFFEKRHAEYFNDKQNRPFTFINLREFDGTRIEELSTFMKSKVDQNSSATTLQDFLLKEAGNSQRIFIIRGLEHITEEARELVCKFLLVLRQDPFNVRFILVSNRPLKETIAGPEYRARLLKYEIYFTPSSMTDLWHEITAYGKIIKKEFSNNERFMINTTAGGLGAYLKAIVTSVKEKGVLEIDSALNVQLDTISEAVLSKFTDEEKNLLVSIAEGTIHTYEEVPDLLRSIGVIRRGNEGPRIFSDAFARYIIERK